MDLRKHCKVTNLLQAASESTTVNSDMVDHSGFEGCLFIVSGSTLLGAASASMRYQMSTANSTANLTNAKGVLSSTKMVAGVNYQVLVMDVYKPTERYGRVQINGTSSGNIESIIAVQYGARRPGSTTLWDSTTLAGSTSIIGPTSS